MMFANPRFVHKAFHRTWNSASVKRLSIQNHPVKFVPITESRAESLKTQLASIIGEKHVSRAEIIRSQHGQDEGPDHGLIPDLVAFPGDVGEVSEICRLCHKDGVPIVPFGTGTGLESGISAIHGGISVDVTRMNRILDYHPEDFDVVVEPGVTREALNHHLKDDGLWFPVDPGANASICGMCATGASGTNAVRYGTIKENCLNLEVVLADGRILHTGGKDKRPKKSSAGYNLTNLFVGSEGTLGIITKATVRLQAQPEAVAAAVVCFSDIQSAVDTVVMTLQCSMPMARIELLDTLAIKACNAYNNLELKETPTLFLEFHSSEAGLEYQTQTVEEIAKGNGGSDFQFATKTEDRNRLWRARHKMHYSGLNLRPGCRMVTTDVCVPISRLPEIIKITREDVDKSGITAPLLGHVGDGNFHVYLLFDPNDPEEYKTCKELANRMAIRALEMGGTCTGEHGIGTGKKNLLHAQYGDVGIDAMWGIKNFFDPTGIMNPGKVLPPIL